MSLETVPLGEVARFIRGVTYKPDDVVSDGDGGIACLRTKNIQSYLDLSDLVYVRADLRHRIDQQVQPDDVLVSSANSWHLVGRAVPASPASVGMLIGGFIGGVRFDGRRVDARYGYRWFSSPEVQARIRSFGQQTTNISNLNVDRTMRLSIPLPPLPEQRRVAAILDEADALRVAQRGSLDALTSTLRSHVLSASPSFGNSAEVTKFGSVQLGRQRAPKYQTGRHSTPYVRVANVHEDRLDLTDVLSMDFNERDRATFDLRYGDILLNEGQSTELVGRPAMWRDEIDGCAFQNTLIRFRPHSDLCVPEFALMTFLGWLWSGEFQRVSSKTSNMAHLSAARFGRMRFPDVPPQEQERQAELYRAVRAARVSGAGRAAKLDALFASLQHRAFRGEL